MIQASAHRKRRVGDLAKATGLTVRALHHYEEIGLLAPSERTGSGHRLYDDAAVERLYRITLLRRLGLSLREIGSVIEDPQWDLRTSISRHVTELERRREAEARMQQRLRKLSAAADDATVRADELLEVLDGMTAIDGLGGIVNRGICFLVYSDLDAAFDFLTGVFRLGPGELARDADGNAIHGELQAGDGLLWLHPESAEFGLASPRSVNATTAGIAVMVDDVDAHHARVVQAGAEVLYAPTDQPYGYREYGVRDCEGGLWSFMRKLS